MASNKLHYSTEDHLCLTRQKKGKHFIYFDQDGKQIQEHDVVERVKALGIPPAWVDVHICDDPFGHLQATGFDAKGRKQYIYHTEWTAKQQQHKFDRLVQFGNVLPSLRESIAGHMKSAPLSKQQVVATVVWLLDNTFIRIGNKQYAQENNSFGLTTMREKHVEIEKNTIEFSFKGKSGQYHEISIAHPRVAKILRTCIELPGYEIFQYLDETGGRQVVDSRDVNEYLQTLSGEELSAKDFRTWGGTTLAAVTLERLGGADSEAMFKKHIVQSVREVAKELGNTPAVCRKYYIHPTVIKTYQTHELLNHFKKILKKENNQRYLSNEEVATLSLLENY